MEMIRKENICMVESIKDKKELFHFLAEFMAKQGQIENDEIEKALDLVDSEVLINYLGVDSEWCKKCRAIWKKMRNRRIGRG